MAHKRGPTNGPKVSVILPFYNVERYIGAAIQSLLAQDFTDFEAVLVDDGSTDASAQFALAEIGRDPRFQVISQSNRGLSVARNTGLDLARGTYIAFLDGDDSYAPGFLSEMTRMLDGSGANWVACAIRLDYPDQPGVPHSAIHGTPQIETGARCVDLADARTIARHLPSAWNKLYRRDFIGSLRFPPGALYEDHPFYWALACRATQMSYLPQLLYHHRRGRAGQITAQANPQIFQQFDRIEEVRTILAGADKHHKQAALSRLATRLVHERLEPVTDPELRRAFLVHARGYFSKHGLQWDWDATEDIDLGLATAVRPGLRFTALVQRGAGEDLTRAALDTQRLPAEQVVPVPDGAPLQVLHAILPQIGTPWVAIFQAGDIPAPNWSAEMLRALQGDTGAQWAVCATLHSAGARPDTGWAQPGLPCAEPAALMLATDRPPPSAGDGAWTAALRHAVDFPPAQVAQSLVTLTARPIDTPMATLRRLQVLRADGVLEPRHMTAAFLHRAQLAVLARSGRARRLVEALKWGLVRRIGGLPRTTRAAHIGPRLWRIL